MALDFNQVSQQVQQMGSALRANADDRQGRVTAALATLLDHSARWEHWRDHASSVYARSPWLLAAPAEPLATRIDLPPCPAAYQLTAVDGSQIDLDRHGAVECFLINLGVVMLQYGPQPSCRLWSAPHLFYAEDDLVLRDDRGRHYSMAGAMVHAERDTREGIALAEVIDTVAPHGPRIAMQDGTLIRWSLGSFDPWVRDYFLNRYLDDGLTPLRERDVPLCSYISRPRAPEATGLARLIHDPNFEQAHKPNGAGDPYRGVMDALMFGAYLADGQRSAIFKSLSKINADGYGDHAIHFFYLHIGHELVRIELPEWVAQQPDWVDLIHAVAYDQAQRGGGYPAALARAHEQAVVRETDRRTFLQMLETALWHSRLARGSSLKASSKEAQWV